MKCISCGKEMESTTSGNPMCLECDLNLRDILNRERLNTKVQPDKPFLTGWICPVCGRGMSPYESYCNCNGNKFTPSWPVTTTITNPEYVNTSVTEASFDSNAVGNILY